MQPRGQTVPSYEFGLLVLLGILWGIPYALTKISLATIPPITLTAARVSVAAATMWIVAYLLRRKVPRQWDFAGRIFIQGVVACVIPYTLIAFGQQSVDSGLAAILNSSTPLFVCLIGVMWTRHEAITWDRLAGALVGVSGVVLIIGTSALAGLSRPSIGQAAIILATFSSAVSVIYGRRFNDAAPEVVAAGMLTCAAIALVPLALYVEEPWHAEPSSASILALVGNAVGATALGFTIYFRLIRTVGSMSTASTGYIKPLVGVLIGCTLFGEIWTWTMGFGMLAIIIGIACINGKVSMSSWWNTRIRAGATMTER